MQPALTTLANVKAWVTPITTTTDDGLLTALIDRASRMIMSYLQRPSLFQQNYSDVYDGSGSGRQMLRNWPVLSVSSLTNGTCPITAASGYGQAGYALDAWDGLPPGRQQGVNISCGVFWMGHNNVAVSYVAGYVVQKEAQTVPAISSYTITVNAPYGNWAVDQGVTYANGTALTPVAGTPAEGQYSVSVGVYTFSSADALAAVLISYSYIPFDIEQACIELVSERYRYRSRIGEKSHSSSGMETTAFDNSGLTDYAKTLLQPYRRVTPL